MNCHRPLVGMRFAKTKGFFEAGSRVIRTRSRPMRARGLKLVIGFGLRRLRQVAPHVGAWIETWPLFSHCVALGQSRPMRARGLKLVQRAGVVVALALTRTVQARRSKRSALLDQPGGQEVVLHAGFCMESTLLFHFTAPPSQGACHPPPSACTSVAAANCRFTCNSSKARRADSAVTWAVTTSV